MKLRDERKNENFSFFPFNEGEKVEKQRAEQKIVLNAEMRERSRQLSMTKPMSSYVNPNRSTEISNFMAKTNSFMPINSGDFEVRSVALNSTGFVSPQNGSQREPPDSFKKTYPKFLEPHKHYPYRRLKDDHVEKVMQDAIKRVEDDLKVKYQINFILI